MNRVIILQFRTNSQIERGVLFYRINESYDWCHNEYILIFAPVQSRFVELSGIESIEIFNSGIPLSVVSYEVVIIQGLHINHEDCYIK